MRRSNSGPSSLRMPTSMLRRSDRSDFVSVAETGSLSARLLVGPSMKLDCSCSSTIWKSSISTSACPDSSMIVTSKAALPDAASLPLWQRTQL